MNQMLKPSETNNKAVLVHYSHIIHHNPSVAKTQAGQSDLFALFLSSPACNPYHQTSLHGSAISNAKQHSSHDRINHNASTNEGKNEEMRGMTTPALQ